MHAATAAPSQSKPDDLFGVCAAVGEDFGFNPLWLRIALGAGVLWNPLAVLGIYVGLGMLVLATRFLFPDRKPAAAEQSAHLRPEAANVEAENAEAEFALAA